MWIAWLIVGIWVGILINIVYDWAGRMNEIADSMDEPLEGLVAVDPARAIREVEASGGVHRPSACSRLADGMGGELACGTRERL